MSESVISSTMFICEVLIAMVTWSGLGSSSASMCRVSSDSHLASPSSPSGENEIEPPTCRIISGTASRSRRSSSLNCDSRLEPLPSSSRTWMCSTVAPASQQSTACCTCWSIVTGMSSGKSAGSHSGPYGRRGDDQLLLVLGEQGIVEEMHVDFSSLEVWVIRSGMQER